MLKPDWVNLRLPSLRNSTREEFIEHALDLVHIEMTENTVSDVKTNKVIPALSATCVGMFF